MLQVLSIQSDIIGNKTYSTILRECFAQYPDLKVDSQWYNSGRSIATRVLHKLVSVSTPLLDRNGRNLDMRRGRTEWSYGRTSALLTRSLLAEQKYQLLHFHTQVQAYGSVNLMKKIPTIITTDMTASLASRDMTVQHPRTYQISINLDRKVFEAAAHIVVFTEWARQSVVQDYKIPLEKVSVIPPGARLQTFAAPDFTRRAKPRLIFIGGDFKRKGGWDVLDVFTNHFSDVAELHLVTNEPIQNAGRNVYIHAGVMPYTPQWHSVLRNSDILVVPSHAEPYGLVFQEAGGYGLALVGSRVGGIPEIVVEGETGLLVEPGSREDLKNALDSLINNPLLLDRMRERSYEIALKRFNAMKNMRRLADCFIRVHSEYVSHRTN
jgi:glycosyltransferase involved in cell wall biosynthesis